MERCLAPSPHRIQRWWPRCSGTDPDLSKLPEQRVALRDEIKSQKARDRNSLFEAGLREALIKQGKIKIHQEVINRLIAGYRG